MDIYDIAEQIDSQPDATLPKQPQDIYDIAENVGNQPEDIYDMAEKLDAPDRGALAAAGMWGGRAIAPAMAGLAAGSAAATAVAPSLGTGIPGVVLTLGTGLAAGWSAAMATSKAQDMALEAGLGKEKSQALQREMDIARKQHPIASAGGELAGNLVGLKPDKRTLASGWNFMKALTGNKAQMAEHIAKNPEGLSNALNMVFGAGSQGGIEAYNQISEGDFSPLRLVAQTLAGGLFNAPTKLGAKLMRIKAPIDTTPVPKIMTMDELKAEAQKTGQSLKEVQEAEAAKEQAAVTQEAPPVETAPDATAVDKPQVEGLIYNGVQKIDGMPDQHVFTDKNTKSTFYSTDLSPEHLASERDRIRANFVEQPISPAPEKAAEVPVVETPTVPEAAAPVVEPVSIKALEQAAVKTETPLEEIRRVLKELDIIKDPLMDGVNRLFLDASGFGVSKKRWKDMASVGLHKLVKAIAEKNGVDEKMIQRIILKRFDVDPITGKRRELTFPPKADIKLTDAEITILKEDVGMAIQNASADEAKGFAKPEPAPAVKPLTPKQQKVAEEVAALVKREEAARAELLRQKNADVPADEAVVKARQADAEAIVKAKEDEARIKEENRKKQIELFGSEDVAQKKKAKVANEADEELIGRQVCEVEFKKGKDEKMR